MSIRFYGNNMIVGHGTDGDKYTKKEVVRMYNNFTYRMRQYDRIQSDLDSLSRLSSEKKYTVDYRQYTGHPTIPETTQGLKCRIFISSAIAW